MSERDVMAWLVPNDDDSVIVFASTERAAACIASEELGIAMDELRAERLPEMDQYAPGPIEARVLLTQHKWAVHCETCGAPIFPNDIKKCVTQDHLAFCDLHCAKHYLTIMYGLEHALLRARQSIYALCPDARLVRWWIGGDLGTIFYQFFAPGTLHVVTWREDKPKHMFCVAHDLEQIEEYRTLSRRVH